MNIQIYAEKAKIDAEQQVMNIWLDGVDIAQIIAEFNINDVLESIPTDEIEDYLNNLQEE